MDRKKLFPIGEVSKLFHISVSSLRRYETIGLLTPAYISPDSGYRYYGPEQFEVLNTIRYLRALDMPLPEIADFLQNRDIDRIEEKLQQQKQAVLQKQQALKRMEQKIDHRLRWLRDAQSAPLDTVCLVQLPACRIVWVSDCLRIGASADMEAPIRKVRRRSRRLSRKGRAGYFGGASAKGADSAVRWHLSDSRPGRYLYRRNAGAAGNTLCAAALSGQPCRCACAVSEASSLYGRAPDADFRLFPGGHAH